MTEVIEHPRRTNELAILKRRVDAVVERVDKHVTESDAEIEFIHEVLEYVMAQLPRRKRKRIERRLEEASRLAAGFPA